MTGSIVHSCHQLMALHPAYSLSLILKHKSEYCITAYIVGHIKLGSSDSREELHSYLSARGHSLEPSHIDGSLEVSVEELIVVPL